MVTPGVNSQSSLFRRHPPNMANHVTSNLEANLAPERKKRRSHQHIFRISPPPGDGLGAVGSRHLAEDDDTSKFHEESAKMFRIASEFMQGEVFQQVMLLAAPLQPERKLMDVFVHSISRDWENKQMEAEWRTGSRQYRILRHFDGADLDEFFQSTMAMLSSSCWKGFVETERFRSTLLRHSMRSGAVVFQLVSCRVKQAPYKLFQLLNRNTLVREQAEDLLRTPPCQRDPFTSHVFKKYRTPEELAGEEAFLFLALVARKCMCSTYTTERLHSRNLRRAKSRTMTQRIDMKDLALPHVAHAGPPFCHVLDEQMQRKSKEPEKKRGRPSKRKHVESEADENVASKRRRGGGGAWRAFQQLQFQGRKFSAELIRELSEKYRALSAEERLYYEEVGRAGLNKVKKYKSRHTRLRGGKRGKSLAKLHGIAVSVP
eukprot:6470178-Amphidinium_carterae.2